MRIMARRAQADGVNQDDLWVDNLYYGDGLKALSEAELDLVNGVTAGAITASKAVTAGSDGFVPHQRHIIADGADVTLAAEDSGALCVFDKTDGAQFTLPAAAAGLFFDFVIVASASSTGYRVECASGDFILGSVLLDDSDTGLATTAQAANGSSHLAIDLDAATDGWLAGGFFRLTAISASQWVINGHLLHTGNVASPFETS
jgi:hypothetical protein